MFFQYSFTCPECSETIGPGTEMIVADNREAVPPEVYKKHPDCPYCGKPLPAGETIKVTVWEA
jgi:uncharacterized protein with PIN domain